ncbi:MAG: Gldg family protein, partial [Planctomycetaceae bacterium]
MRGHVILAVWKRNVSSFFTGVLGYLFMVVFVAAAAILAFSDEFFSNNLANLDQLNDKFSMLLLFIIPAITMSAWSDERKMGTDELLFTLPATDLEILLAKYFSVLSVYTVALMFSLCQLGVLARYADPEWGLLITTYFGYWLSGASLLSVGMFASALTSSATVAFVLGVVICAVPVFIGDLSSGNQLLRSLSLDEQFREFALGTVPLVGLMYFVSLTAFMLYLNMVVISKRHWSGDQQANMGLQFAVRTASLAAILISVNFMARASGGLFNLQVDLTAENLYSLSETTKETLDDVDADTLVTIHAFMSEKMPPELVEQRNRLMGLLRQYDRRGGARVQVRFVDEVVPYSDEAEEAELYGVMPRRVQTEVGGRLMAEDVFLGLVISGPYDEVVVPFVEAKMPIEYELTRSIRTVTVQRRKTIGVLRTDAQVAGGFEPGSFRNLPEWQFVGELKKQYKVESVAADAEILHQRFTIDGKQELAGDLQAGKLSKKLMERFVDQDIQLSNDARLVEDGPRWIVEDGDSRLFIKLEENGSLNVSSPFDVLVAILPSSLTQPQMANLVNYVRAGYPVLIFDDPLPATIGMQLAPRQQKRRPQGGGMFGGGGPPPEQKADGGRATSLLDVLEVAWEYDVVVWDSYNPHPNLEDLVDPELVWISPASGRKSAFSQTSEVTSGLQEMLAFFPGHIQHRKGGSNAWDDLLTTTEGSGIVRWEDLVQETFMGAGL